MYHSDLRQSVNVAYDEKVRILKADIKAGTAVF
jgi:hypothetical protein